MKTRREQSFAVARTAFSLSALIRDNMRCGGLSALILAHSALHLLLIVPSALAASPSEEKTGTSQQWSLRVDQVDTGDVSLDPSLEFAFHKSLLKELAKTKRFKQVFFHGDRGANDVPDLLTLKMTVQEHAPGSDTRRVTVGDAGVLGIVVEDFLKLCGRSAVNKLNARIQIYTPEGRLVLDNVVAGDVGFTGDNLRAPNNLSHNVAVTLKRAVLPDTAIVDSERETARKN